MDVCDVSLILCRFDHLIYMAFSQHTYKKICVGVVQVRFDHLYGR